MVRCRDAIDNVEHRDDCMTRHHYCTITMGLIDEDVDCTCDREARIATGLAEAIETANFLAEGHEATMDAIAAFSRAARGTP